MTCRLLWPSAIWFAPVTTISSPAVVAFAGAVSFMLSRTCWFISVSPTTSGLAHVRGVVQLISASSPLPRQHCTDAELADAQSPEVHIHRRQLPSGGDVVALDLAPDAVDVVGAGGRLQRGRRGRGGGGGGG